MTIQDWLRLAYTHSVKADVLFKIGEGKAAWLELGNAKAMAENAVDAIADEFRKKQEKEKS